MPDWNSDVRRRLSALPTLADARSRDCGRALAASRRSLPGTDRRRDAGRGGRATGSRRLPERTHPRAAHGCAAPIAFVAAADTGRADRARARRHLAGHTACAAVVRADAAIHPSGARRAGAGYWRDVRHLQRCTRRHARAAAVSTIPNVSSPSGRGGSIAPSPATSSPMRTSSRGENVRSPSPFSAWSANRGRTSSSTASPRRSGVPCVGRRVVGVRHAAAAWPLVYARGGRRGQRSRDRHQPRVLADAARRPRRRARRVAHRQQSPANGDRRDATRVHHRRLADELPDSLRLDRRASTPGPGPRVVAWDCAPPRRRVVRAGARRHAGDHGGAADRGARPEHELVCHARADLRADGRSGPPRLAPARRCGAVGARDRVCQCREPAAGAKRRTAARARPPYARLARVAAAWSGRC